MKEAIGFFGIFSIIGVVVLLFVLFICSISVVGAGEVGILVVFGNVQSGVLQSGLNFLNPFAIVHKMSVRTENYWMSHNHQEGDTKGDDSVDVRSSNGLQMPIDVSVPYRLIPDSATWVFSNLGKDYVAKLVRPALSTAARRAASRYTAEQLYSTKRDEFAETIRIVMEEELEKMLKQGYEGRNPPQHVIVISQVLVGHVGIPESVRTAIESKLKVDQEQQAMDFQILKEHKEAERKKIEAEGIQKFQEIVSKGIDDRLLRWKGIDATLKLAESHNAKIIVIGSGKDGLPVLLNTLQDGGK